MALDVLAQASAARRGACGRGTPRPGARRDCVRRWKSTSRGLLGTVTSRTGRPGTPGRRGSPPRPRYGAGGSPARSRIRLGSALGLMLLAADRASALPRHGGPGGGGPSPGTHNPDGRLCSAPEPDWLPQAGGSLVEPAGAVQRGPERVQVRRPCRVSAAPRTAASASRTGTSGSAVASGPARRPGRRSGRPRVARSAETIEQRGVRPPPAGPIAGPQQGPAEFDGGVPDRRASAGPLR